MASAEFSGDSPYDSAVEKICSKDEEDWGDIMEFCDRVISDKESGIKDCLRAIVKRVNGTNGKAARLAVSLLRACFNNSGPAFQKECAQAALMDEIYRLLQTRANTPYQVCEALKDMLQDWVLDHGADSAYARIHSTYTRLKSEGFEFPATTRPIPEPVARGDELKAREEADMARAIAESLKDAVKVQRKVSKHDKEKRRKSLTTGAAVETVPSRRQVRAVYGFEVQETGELGFKAGDIITLLNDEHPDWWKGELNGVTGLFPSNYVEALGEGTRPGADGVGVVDDLLDRLLTAQTSATNMAFNAEIERLYDIVVGTIQPEVHARLNALAAKEADLARINERLCTAMALYDRLHRDAQLAYHTP